MLYLQLGEVIILQFEINTLFCFCESGFHSIAQNSMELTLWPRLPSTIQQFFCRPPKCWDYSHKPLCLYGLGLFLILK